MRTSSLTSHMQVHELVNNVRSHCASLVADFSQAGKRAGGYCEKSPCVPRR